MRLYGKNWTRREFEARVGRVEQVGGVERLCWTEGPEQGGDVISVRTGAGLAYRVVPGKGMDISLAEYGGVPLSWSSPNGDVHAAYYDAEGTEWLRTAGGGLLMTCGLAHAGSPGTADGVRYGMHGRAHHLSARQVCAEGSWEGDEYVMRVRGVIEETAIFGEHLRLTREIRSVLGRNRIEIRDEVENAGFAPAGHMLLYHFNFGFPLLSEETELTFPSHRVTSRDPETPVEGYARWQAPDLGCRERVYYHELAQHESTDWVEAKIHQPRFPLGAGSQPLTLKLGWSSRELPRLVQWKMPGAGVHVLGIEPANCGVSGRASEQAQGSLPMLDPGQQLSYRLVLEVE